MPFTLNTKDISPENTTPTEQSESLAVELPSPSEKQNTCITINNNIQPSMLTYKHWTGKYNPDSFKVFVNDTEIAQGATLQIPSETKTVDLKFDYSFVNGKRTGNKTVSYKLNENISQANITFSWDDDNKIIIDNGTIVAS
jgi:hypothetical protein